MRRKFLESRKGDAEDDLNAVRVFLGLEFSVLVEMMNVEHS